MRAWVAAAAAAATVAAAGCGASSLDSKRLDPDGEGGSGGAIASVPSGGPLATAGPDRMALAGSKVILDGRGSTRAEDGRAIAFLWTQEAGPRVALDDPSATVATFVAPPRSALGGDRLVFRLLVDDGTRTSRDRVAIEVVDRPEQIGPAPLALGGADQEVLRSARVTLPPPAFLDAGCEGGAGCAGGALPYCWTQVDEGARVDLDDPCDGEASFTAPAVPGVLTFRLDAHRRDGTNRSASCRADGEPAPDRPFCAAPDHVRIFVRDRDARRGAPEARIDVDGITLPRVGPPLIVERPAAGYPGEVVLFASHGDPARQQTNTFFGYRPLVGEPPLDEAVLAGLGPLTSEGMLQAHKLVLPRPSWPRTLGVAFEAQYNRVRAAPAALVVSWRPPPGAPPLVAEAAAACGAASGEWCAPFSPGEEVTLRGLAPGHPDPGSLESCWEQLSGPPVALEPAGGCLAGLIDRTFVAPPVPEAGREVPLSFRFRVRDGGPLSSAPDVAVVRVAPTVEAPPLAVTAPPELHAGEPGFARASVPGRGAGLSVRWRQVWTNGAPGVKLAPAADCGIEGACVAFQAPAEAVGGSLVLEAIATDAGGATFTRRLAIPVVE